METELTIKQDSPSFVDIRTIYESDEQRKIEFLSTLYNKDFLSDVIEDLINSNISDEIISGKKVLLKPNWVLHNLKPDDWMCLRTNDNFLLATVEAILKKKPKSIIIGDAPIQDCDWEKMMDKNFIEAIDELSVKYNTQIAIKDFRRTTWNPTKNIVKKDQHPIDEYIIFDVGDQSMLEPVTSKKNPFIIVNYSPDVLAKTHKSGLHQYCVTKDLFESDVVITIPKVKTHQKTGFTNSMKILVGVNGDKEFLPHHRMGGAKDGGDCYPGHNLFRYLSERSFNEANRNRQINWRYQFYYFFTKAFWKLSFPKKKEHSLGAAWYGNDTCWRMVFDLNKVAIYGKKDGTISNEPQRVLYSLCDGIIGGQGDGPLQPIPMPLGMVSFTNNAELMDVAFGYILKMKHEKIPLLKKAKELVDKMECIVLINKKNVPLKSLNAYSLDVIMPPGWQNYDI